MRERAPFIDNAADIVAAYVAYNAVPLAELPSLIRGVHRALANISTSPGAAEADLAAAVRPSKPAVPIKRSITPDYIICLEDGGQFRSLTKHLRSRYNMSPDQYREKWGLKPDYPMVAPSHSQIRSMLAKKMGLGQNGRVRKRAA